MDAAAALADLLEISTQVEAAVVVGSDGAVLGSTLADEERAGALARAGIRLLEAAEEGERDGPAPRPLAQLEAAMQEGSVFVARGDGRTIVATTGPDPTVGLVFYDLKTCLRQLAPEPEAGPEAPPAAAEEPAAEAPPEAESEPAAEAEAPSKPKRTRKKADAEA